MHPAKAARLKALQRHAERLQRRIARLDVRSNRYSWLRVAIFATGLTLGLALGLARDWRLGLFSFILALLLFSGVAAQHRRLEAHLSRLRLLSRLLRDQQARLRIDWSAIAPLPPEPAGSESQPDHPFERDLDISGPRSLHRLLNTASTSQGSQRLRSWLLSEDPDLSTILHRQALVAELVPLRLFRHRLQIESRLAGGQSGILRSEQLQARLQQEQPNARLIQSLILMGSLNLATLILLAGQLWLHLPPWWPLSAALSLLIFLLRRRDAGDLFEEAFELQSTCAQLSAIFAYLERRRFPGQPHLQQLCQPFSASQLSPARALRHLSLLLSLASFGQNLLLTLLLHLCCPWEFLIALRLNAWKARLARQMPRWLETWFELEALCSLATFADLNPDYHWPEFIVPDPSDPATSDQRPSLLYEGQGLGHPLLPPDSKVVNDLALRQGSAIAIITGSNMAGKSTFLRTVGINLVLANAGAPVNAQRLRLTPLRLFACMRINDALTEGASYFYAEVRRLRALLDAIERPAAAPLLFLIDEIFRGTNNRERRIGSRAYLQALAAAAPRCAGLLATHDLDLTQLADTIPGISNYHFREEIHNGAMTFDYRLRPGPCPTTNALTIMRLFGLPVPESESSDTLPSPKSDQERARKQAPQQSEET